MSSILTRYRVYIFGEKNTGKTSCAENFVKRSCATDTTHPDVNNYMEKKVKTAGGNEVKFMIWDSDYVVFFHVRHDESGQVESDGLRGCHPKLMCCFHKRRKAKSVEDVCGLFLSAGSTREKRNTFNFCNRPNVLIFMYDPTVKNTFFFLEPTFQELQNVFSTTPKVLLACKEDVIVAHPENIQVSFEEGERLAQKHGMSFYQVNATDLNSVDQVFQKILNEIHGLDNDPLIWDKTPESFTQSSEENHKSWLFCCIPLKKRKKNKLEDYKTFEE